MLFKYQTQHYNHWQLKWHWSSCYSLMFYLKTRVNPLMAATLPDGSGPHSRTIHPVTQKLTRNSVTWVLIELKGFTRPPNSTDPTSIRHNGASHRTQKKRKEIATNSSLIHDGASMDCYFWYFSGMSHGFMDIWTLESHCYIPRTAPGRLLWRGSAHQSVGVPMSLGCLCDIEGLLGQQGYFGQDFLADTAL